MEPAFLRLDEVVEIHRDQIERYGGAKGIRQMDLLKSALAAPSSTYGGEYLHADLFEMAADYLFHIAGNHPFVDGNKRTAAAAALVFLEMNGVEVDAEEDVFAELVEGVARGEIPKSEVARFLRSHGVTAND